MLGVEQKDVPVYGEWIGTLDGMVNAEIHELLALVQLYRALGGGWQ